LLDNKNKFFFEEDIYRKKFPFELDENRENRIEYLTSKPTHHEHYRAQSTSLNRLSESSFDIYSKHKIKGNVLSELLFYIAAYFSKNLYIEVASASIHYIHHLITSFCSWYGYEPIFIYPYMSATTANKKILLDRTVKRGLEEGRFVSMDGSHGIINKIELLEDGYNKFKNELKKNHYRLELRNDQKDTKEKTETIKLFKYNSNFSDEIYKKIKDIEDGNIKNLLTGPIIIEDTKYRKNTNMNKQTPKPKLRRINTY
jgi:hypothetical protein